MRKKILLTLLIFLSMLYKAHAEESPFYVEAFGGTSILQTEKHKRIKSSFQYGYIISLSGGYKWLHGMRLETEYAFRRNPYKKIKFYGRTFNVHGRFQSSSYMVNLLWDLPYCLKGICPFAGVGIGYSFQQIRLKYLGLSDHRQTKGFAWQVAAGASCPLTCNVDISVEYKFQKGGFSHLYNHSLGIGLKTFL